MIGIADCGINNLLSLQSAFESLGAETMLCREKSQFEDCERLVLPGVGSFGALVKAIERFNFREILTEQVVKQKKPVLGICLGMQVMAKRGYEFGEYAGLGWFDAEIIHLAPSYSHFRVPHIGWNSVNFKYLHPLLSGLERDPDFYFLHSYHMRCNESASVIGESDHGGNFVAALAKENIFATQFHPEKSQATGLTILSNFTRWKP
jgi:glutamine amidotransferase